MLYLAGLGLTVLSSPALAGGIDPASVTSRQRFDIPSQALGDALLVLARQGSVRVLFSYDAVHRYRGRALRGWFSPEEAATRLVDGTPLRVAMTRERTLVIGLRGAQAARALATAATGPAAPGVAQEQEQTRDEDIIVTGTRDNNRTVAQSLAPVDVLGKAEMQQNGKQSVRDLVAALVPSINVSNSGAGASFAVKTLSLRGLASDQVLVLVDGKRRHNTATLFINGTTQNGQSPADLDLIPSNAIDHIEVLRDGASAQYGSDALAGVINIILKKDGSGGASILGGANYDQGGQTGRFQIDKGVKFENGGHLHLSVDGYAQNRTIRGGLNTSVLYPTIAGAPDPREATADRAVNKPGQPHVKGINTAYDAAVPIGPDVELYTFGTWSDRRADSWLTYRNPNAQGNILAVYPDGYVPKLKIHDQDVQLTGGARGELGGGVHFDLSTGWSKNRVDYRETSALNASMGPASPTAFYIGFVRSTQWTSNLDLSKKFDIGLFKPVLVAAGLEYREDKYTIGAGELASYVDGGYRSPTGSYLANVARQAGSQGVTGFPPSAAGTFDRNNWSAYLNIEGKPTEWLDFGIAGRHERYSDFGSTDTGKVSLRIAPTSQFAFRGTISTGFRAPTLQQQHYASSSTIGVLLPGATTTVLAPVRALPVSDPVAIAWGAQPLKPEKSTNYSVGMVWTPVSNFNFTVDAYEIDIRDRIMLSGTLTGAATSATTYNGLGTLLQKAGLNPVQSGFFFSNAASTRTRGLDMVATYHTQMGDLGKATITLSANFNATKFTRLEVPPALAAIGVTLIDRARQGDFTKGTPRDKQIANIYWERGIISWNLRATRYGQVTQVAAAKAADGIYHDDTIQPKVLLDTEIGVRLTDFLKISAGANNLLNTYPSVLDAVNRGNTGFAYYNPYSPYGISGGFYYGKINVTF